MLCFQAEIEIKLNFVLMGLEASIFISHQACCKPLFNYFLNEACFEHLQGSHAVLKVL